MQYSQCLWQQLQPCAAHSEQEFCSRTDLQLCPYSAGVIALHCGPHPKGASPIQKVRQAEEK